MSRAPRTLFLAPAPYRRRRLIDAARLLPVFAVFMVLVPPLLQSGDGGGGSGAVLIYLFVLWALIVLAAGLIARAMTRMGPDKGLEDAVLPDRHDDGAS